MNQFEEEYGYYQATLPSNIASGTFVQSAGDIADYLQDSVDGINESGHVMTMVFRTRCKEPGSLCAEH